MNAPLSLGRFAQPVLCDPVIEKSVKINFQDGINSFASKYQEDFRACHMLTGQTWKSTRMVGNEACVFFSIDHYVMQTGLLQPDARTPIVHYNAVSL